MCVDCGAARQLCDALTCCLITLPAKGQLDGLPNCHPQVAERLCKKLKILLVHIAEPERRQDEHLNGEQDEFRSKARKKEDDEMSFASRGCVQHA